MLLRAALRGRVAHFGVEGSERGVSGKLVVVCTMRVDRGNILVLDYGGGTLDTISSVEGGGR
jgi:hypothetical protein